MIEKYLDFATVNTNEASAKELGYLAVSFNVAAESVKSVLDIGINILGGREVEKLWDLYESLRLSAISAERPFDLLCIEETGRLQGPAGGFASLDDAVDTYMAYREAKLEED